MRRRSGVALAALVVCAIAGLVIVAVNADGRAHARSDTNDGGAWLLNLADREIGHVNRVAAEVTSTVLVDAEVFEVDQAPGVVLVHDLTHAGVSLLDGATGVLSPPVRVPESAAVTAVPDGMVVFDPDSGDVWRHGIDSLLAVASVEDTPALIEAGRGASVAVGLDGAVAVHDPADGLVWWSRPGAEPTPTSTDLEDAAVLSTLVGERLVLVDADSVVWVVDADGTTPWEPGVEWVVLQQPSPVGTELFGIDADGDLVQLSLLTGEVLSEERLAGEEPLRPIVHRGEVWSVMRSPSPTLYYRDQMVAGLDDVDPDSLRLRLVNGWVWANDASDGDGFLLVDQGTVISVRDWPSFTDQLDDSSDIENDQTTVTDDAEVLGESIERELEEGDNLPPDARSDDIATRANTPVTVHVLANDSDRNGDALSVVAVTEPASDAVVSIVGDGEAVSVVPPADSDGDIVFEYTVSDGRPGGTATATVTVTVVPAEGNQPPETQADELTVGAGARRSVDVVFNDTDPDGDPITLVRVDTTAAPEGTSITSTPEGLVWVSVPEGTAAGPFELPYTVVDDREEQAEGVLTVTVVPEAENMPPVLLPERLTLFPDEAGSIDVLVNDVDAEDDDLTAGGLEALDGSPDATLAPDGTFTFSGADAGQYRYRYTVTDGTNERFSFVRVDVVEPPEENAPPIAGVDEVTLPVGLSRIVRVLDNDVDPDGEVVGIVYWEPVEGLSVDPVPGVGFRMSATVPPPATILFPYWISDGTNEPVEGLVVARVSAATAGLPPVAVDDEVELRAGQTSAVQVLGNDYDPDGDILQIVAETLPTAPGATTQLGEGGQWLSVSLAPEAEGDLELRYEIVDADGNPSSAVLSVRVIRPGTPNRSPVVAPDVARTQVGQRVAIDPLANDRDPDGDPLVLSDVAVVGNSGATVEIIDGIVQYTPAPDFVGTDRLTYTVVDVVPAAAHAGDVVAVEGAIAVGVVRYGLSDEEEVNIRPTAVDDGPQLPQVLIGGGPVELDLLRNDFDDDGDRLTILPITSQPTVGSVDVVRDGRAVSYTPPTSGEPRQVTFRYTITDGLDQDDATVTVTLVAERTLQRPLARDDSIVLRRGETATVAVLDNDDDPDGDIADVEIQPSPDGAYRVVPGGIEVTAGDTTATIPYTIVDPDGLDAQAVVTVQVAENRRPVARSFEAEVPYETATVIDLAAAGAGDPDLPDDVLTLTVEGATGGTAERAGELAVRFTPTAGSTEPGSFRYILTDDAGETATGTVTVTITDGPPTNEPPVATSREVRLEAGTSFPVELDLLVDDPDTEIGDLEFSGGGAAQGVVSTSLVGSTLTITAPLTAGDATDTITWTVSDGTETATANIEVTVTAAVFDPPAARNYTGADRRVISRGETVTIDVIADAQDNLPDEIRGGGLRIVSVDGETGGSATFSGRTVSFTPAPGARSGSFSYTIADAQDGRAVGRVEVAVLDAPTAPTAVAATATETTVTVTWAPPADLGGSAVTGYTVALTGGGVSRSEPAGASDRSLTLEGLPDSTAFQITVTATNAVDTSPAAPTTVSTVVPLQPPGPVVGLTVTATARGTVTASWSPPTTGDAPTLYRYSFNGGTPTETTATSVPITGLGDGVVVEVTVVAVNPADAGPPATASGRTWAPPGRVVNLSATPGAYSYTANWQAPGGGAAFSYEIATQEGGGGCAGNWRPASPGVRLELPHYYAVQSICVRAIDANGLIGPPTGPVTGGALEPSTAVAVSPPCSSPTCPAQSIRVTIRNHPPGSTYVVSCNPGSSETIVVNGSGAYDGNHCAGIWPPEPAVGPDTVMYMSGLPIIGGPGAVVWCSREICSFFY